MIVVYEHMLAMEVLLKTRLPGKKKKTNPESSVVWVKTEVDIRNLPSQILHPLPTHPQQPPKYLHRALGLMQDSCLGLGGNLLGKNNTEQG